MKHILICIVLLGAKLPSLLQAQTTLRGDKFARYTPNECSQHAVNRERRYWRDKRPDTVYVHPLNSTYSPEVVDSVRRCLARFVVDEAPERDLLMLGEGYLIINDDVQAENSFKRLISLQRSKSVQVRGWLLAQIINSYANAKPSRLGKAFEYMSRLDDLGVPAARERLLGWHYILKVVQALDSLPLIETSAKAAIKAGSQMIGDVRKQRSAEEAQAYIALAGWYSRRFMNDSAVSVVAGAKKRLVPFMASSAQLLQEYEMFYKFMGRKPAPLQSTWQFNPGLGSSRNAVYPNVGKPALIMFVNHTCKESCYNGYGVFRRLFREYSAHIDFIQVTNTYGYHGARLYSPDKEANYNEIYFIKHLQVPGTMLVWRSEFQFREDGGRMYNPQLNWSEYVNMGRLPVTVPIVLLDREGRIRMRGDLSQATEAFYSNLIKEIM